MKKRNSGRQENDKDFWKLLEELLVEFNQYSHNGKRRVGNETQKYRRKILKAGFSMLKNKLNFRIQDPKNFRKAHMRAMVHAWEDLNLGTATIQNYVSQFNVFCGWIRKPNMVKNAEEFTRRKGAATRQTATKRDKSWEANGVNAKDVIAAIKVVDIFVGCQAHLMSAFGMRLKETVFFLPFQCDKGSHLEIFEGTKGRRRRAIPIETTEQRELVDFCKELVKTANRSVVNPRYGNTEKQKDKARSHTYYVFDKFGITKNFFNITPHGLRHEYALHAHKECVGVEAPIRGGSTNELDRQKVHAGKMELSERLGHSRKSILGTYIGATRTPKVVIDYLNCVLVPEKKVEIITSIYDRWGEGTAEALACEAVLEHLDKAGGNIKDRLSLTILGNISQSTDLQIVPEIVAFLSTGETPIMLKTFEYVEENGRRHLLTNAAFSEANELGYFKNSITGFLDADYLLKIKRFYSRNDAVWGVVKPTSHKQKISPFNQLESYDIKESCN